MSSPTHIFCKQGGFWTTWKQKSLATDTKDNKRHPERDRGALPQEYYAALVLNYAQFSEQLTSVPPTLFIQFIPHTLLSPQAILICWYCVILEFSPLFTEDG